MFKIFFAILLTWHSKVFDSCKSLANTSSTLALNNSPKTAIVAPQAAHYFKNNYANNFKFYFEIFLIIVGKTFAKICQQLNQAIINHSNDLTDFWFMSQTNFQLFVCLYFLFYIFNAKSAWKKKLKITLAFEICSIVLGYCFQNILFFAE